MRKYAANAFIISIFLIIILSHFVRDLWLLDWVFYSCWSLFLASAALWCVLSLDKVRLWLKKRSTQFALGLVFTGVGLILIVGVVNWLASSNNKTWDLTANKIHSLSDQSQKVLKGLKEKVSVEVWTTSIKQMSGSLDMDRFLNNYKEASNGKVEVIVKNPISDPAGAQKSKITRNNVLVVKSSSGRETRIENFSDSKAEEQLTNAVIQVIKGSKKTVCITSGHKELDVHNTEAEGLSFFKDALANSSYEVRDLILAALDEVPAYCEALIIPGPQSEAVEKEVKMLKAYIEKGGPTLALFGIGTPASWSKLFENYGVSINKDVVIDPRVQQPPLGVLTKNYSSGVEIVKSFSQPVFFTFASSVKMPTQSQNPNIEVRSFVSSESVSYSKNGDLSNLRGGIGKKAGDQQGPLAIGVLIEDKNKKKAAADSNDEHGSNSSFSLFPSAYAENAPTITAPATPAAGQTPAAESPAKPGVRIILFGNHHFAMNAIVQQFANMDLLLSSVNYLLEDNDVMGIRPRDNKDARLELTEKNIYQVRGYIVLAACMFIVLGVWATRRRRAS
jgi:ABC-type uncharacterized transport system involved in gliding motility auxiliary subunit